VNRAATVEGDAKVRLFCGLRLPDDAADTIAAWQTRLHRGRIVPRDNLHLTLAFLGWRPREDVDGVVAALRRRCAETPPPVFELERYRETRSVGMLVLDDEGGAATALAADLHERLERLGVYERENRPWLPHLTVLRFRQRPKFSPPVPQVGPFSPSDAAVYHSVLRSHGAQYFVVESYALGG